MPNFPRISPAFKRCAKQIKLLLMDVDGTMTGGGVALLSQNDGTTFEIKTFDAHDGQGVTLAHTAGPRTGCTTGRESARPVAPRPGNEDGIYLHEAAIENAGLGGNSALGWRCIDADSRPSARRLPPIENLTIQCVGKFVTLPSGPVWKPTPSHPPDHMLPARQVIASVFKFLLVQGRAEVVYVRRERHALPLASSRTRRLTLHAKETAFFEIVKRGGTRRIAALGDHDLPLSLCLYRSVAMSIGKEYANELPSKTALL